MTAPRANLEIVRLVARIRRLSYQKNKIFGKVSATLRGVPTRTLERILIENDDDNEIYKTAIARLGGGGVRRNKKTK